MVLNRVCLSPNVIGVRSSDVRTAYRGKQSDYGSVDHGFDEDRVKKAKGEINQREFTYFLLGDARIIYACTARLALIKVL